MNAPLTLTPRSSLGSKFLMAVTGLGLTVFVIAHMLGNVQVFAGRDAVNSYAAALKHAPGLLWPARVGLLTIFVLHVGYGAKLWLANRAARPVPYHFKRYRDLSREGASTADVLRRNAGIAEAVHHGKHADHLRVSADERDGEELLHSILGNEFEVGAGHLAGVIRPEDFLGRECLRGNAFWENKIDMTRGTLFGAQTNTEDAIFEKRDEAPAESQEIRSANDEGFEKLVEFSDRA